MPDTVSDNATQTVVESFWSEIYRYEDCSMKQEVKHKITTIYNLSKEVVSQTDEVIAVIDFPPPPPVVTPHG